MEEKAGQKQMETERSVSSLQHPLSDPPAPWLFAVGAEGAAGVVSVLMIVAGVKGRDAAQKQAVL